MITLSFNFDRITGKSDRASHEKKVKEIVGTHLAFPGSDKLKLGVTVKDNGFSSVTFAGPKDIVDEAKRLWNENVKPAADRAKAVVAKTTSSLKRKVVKSRPKTKAKKIRVAVKAKVTKKPASKKKKK